MRKVILPLVVIYIVCPSFGKQGSFRASLMSAAENSIGVFRKQALESYVESKEKWKIPEKPKYSSNAFELLDRVSVKVKSQADVDNNIFMSNAIDHVINPFVSAVAPLGGVAGMAVGLTITTPLELVAIQARSHIRKIEFKQREMVNNLFASAISGNSDLTKDLYRIAREPNKDLREQEIRDFSDKFRSTYLEKHREADADGKFDENLAKIAINGVLTDVAIREIFNNKNIITRSNRKFRKSLVSHFDKISTNKEGVDKNSKSIYKLGKALSLTQQKQVSSFKKLAKMHGDYANRTKEAMDLMNGKISSLLMHKFYKMGPSEKIQSLKKGGLLHEHIPSGARSALIESYKSAASLEKFALTAKNAINTLRVFSQVGHDLGLDKKLLKTIDSAVEFTGPIINLATGLIPPYNPVAIMSGIGGILGKKSKKASVQEQMMKALNHLIEGQRQILRNQRKMSEELKAIKAGQVAIFDQLSVIDQKLNTIGSQLEGIRHDLLINRNLIKQGLLSDFKPCLSILSDVNKYDHIDQEDISQFQFVFENSYDTTIQNCINAFDNTFSLFVKDQGYFKSIYSIVDNKDEEAATYQKMHQLTLRAFANNGKQAFHGLISPLKDFSKIKDKVTFYKRQDFKTYPYFEGLLSDKVSLDLLSESTNIFDQLQPYLNLYFPTMGHFLEDEAYKQKSIKTESILYNVVDNIYYASYIPVAQENILSGELVLDYVFENRSQSFPKDEFLSNELFAKNYLRYFIYQKKIRNQVKISMLQTAIAFQNKKFLEGYFADFGGGLKVVTSTKRKRLLKTSSFLSKLKEDVLAFSGAHLDQSLNSYDPGLYDNRDLGLEKNDVKAFLQLMDSEVTSVINQLSQYINAGPSESKNVLRKLIDTIEKNKVGKEGSNFYAHPHDHSVKRYIVGSLRSFANRYLQTVRTFYEESGRNMDVWLEIDGQVIALPSSKEMLSMEIERSPNFKRAMRYLEHSRQKMESIKVQQVILKDPKLKEADALFFDSLY